VGLAFKQLLHASYSPGHCCVAFVDGHLEARSLASAAGAGKRTRKNKPAVNAAMRDETLDGDIMRFEDLFV